MGCVLVWIKTPPRRRCLRKYFLLPEIPSLKFQHRVEKAVQPCETPTGQGFHHFFTKPSKTWKKYFWKSHHNCPSNEKEF